MADAGAISLSQVSKVFAPLNGKMPWPKVLGVQRTNAQQGLRALDSISFHLDPGEVVGLIGVNGSGKSTLLQLIAGTLQPSAGRIDAKGRISALLELGSGFNPDFSGLENIFLTASILGMSREDVESRLDRIVEFSGVGDFLDYPVRTYSSGMALRLAFAIQTQVEPDILIVDEALAVGDIYFQQKCYQYLREDLDGVTRILATHDLDSLSKVAPRTLVLERGRLRFNGPTREAIELYVKLAQEVAFGRVDAPMSDAGENVSIPDGLPWCEPGEDQLSGRREIRIVRTALTDLNHARASVLVAGSAYVLHFELQLDRGPADLILGYIVHDRQGQNVCGGTSIDAQGGPVQVQEAGTWHVELELQWPALRADEYTLTVGVGEGTDVQGQVVQCWANHVFQIRSSLEGRPGDQLITVPAKEVRVNRA